MGERGPKAPVFFGRGRIKLRLVEPSGDDEEVDLRRLVPIDDLLHFAREEGTPVRPTAVHVGQAVLLRKRPGGEQAPALRADVRVGGQRRHGPPHQAGRLGPREVGVLLDGVAPVRLGDPEGVEYGLGAQEPRGDRQRRDTVGTEVGDHRVGEPDDRVLRQIVEKVAAIGERVAVRDVDDESGVPLDHQRRAVPAGDDVVADRPLQHVLPLGDREFPERPSPFRQRVTTPDVVHQDVERACLGTDPREELLHFGFDRVVRAYGDAPASPPR